METSGEARKGQWESTQFVEWEAARLPQAFIRGKLLVTTLWQRGVKRREQAVLL